MSDQSQGPGWWYASDGKWYPPEQAAGVAAPGADPTTPTSAGQPVWDGTQWVYPAADPSTVDASPTPAAGQPVWDGAQWVYKPAAPAAAPTSAPTAPAGPAVASPAHAPGAPQAPVAPSPGGTSKVPLVLAIGVFAVLLVGAGIFVVKRGGGDAALGSAPLADGAVASGADELPSNDVVLGEKTVVVRGNGGKTLKSVAPDGSTFTLDGGADGVDKLSEGSILLLTGVTVVKVTGVERNGDDVVIKTKAAAIGEVIKDGSLSWNDVKTGPGTLNVWDARPEDHEVEDGTVGGDSGKADPEAGDGSNFGPVAPGLLGAAPPLGAAGVLASRAQADPVSKSGTLGDWKYSYNQTGGLDGSSTYKITVTKEGNLLVKIDLDATVEPIITGGNIRVQGSTLDKLHLKTDKFKGTAKVHIEAGTGGDIAPVKQEILTVPIEAKYPIVIYGIPFVLGIKGKFLLEPAFTSRNTTMNANAEVSFGGSAGLTYEGGNLSAEGALVTKAEDPIKQVQALGVGVTGMVYAAQFPRISFGLGYGSSTAGVYIASTTSVGATVGSSIGMVECRQVSITETVSAGAEAAFLGIEIPLGKKVTAEIYKKTWGFYEPKVNACKIEGAEEGGG